jgi:hypothetical protein
MFSFVESHRGKVAWSDLRRIVIPSRGEYRDENSEKIRLTAPETRSSECPWSRCLANSVTSESCSHLRSLPAGCRTPHADCHYRPVRVKELPPLHFSVAYQERQHSSVEIVPVEIHHLVPCRNKVIDKFLVDVGASIDLGECAQLRV